MKTLIITIALILTFKVNAQYTFDITPEDVNFFTALNLVAPSITEGQTLFYKDELLFTARSSNSTNRTLFKTDGTQNGSVLVKDLEYSITTKLTPFNNKVYFANGLSIWETDGTENGTIEIYQLPDSTFYWAIFDLVEFQNKLFFLGSDGTNIDLYATDGTTSGTYKVKEINATGKNDLSVGIKAFNNHLYFELTTPGEGSELWISDGTSSGTHILKDINTGTASSEPYILGATNNLVFFFADHPSYGRELWKTDGTNIGTELVKDIRPGTDNGLTISSSVNFSEVFNDKLYFVALDNNSQAEYWYSDGTNAGTQMLKNISSNGFGTSYFEFRPIVFDNHLYFSSYDTLYGEEIYKTDGTEAGTELVKDINIGNDNSIALYTSRPSNSNHFYFDVKHDAPFSNASYIWYSDGTENGTQKLMIDDDICSTGIKYNAKVLYADDDMVFFTASCTQYSDECKLYVYRDSLSTSVNEISFINDLNFYPNPVQNVLNISLELEKPQEISYSIINSIGKLVYSNNIFSKSILNEKIDVSKLSSGIYFLKIQGENNSLKTLSFVKK